jgi:hypothetical protein
MTATTNINLKVPFAEKDQAKALGARWNAELKLWYVPQGLDTAPFEKWLTTSSSSQAVFKSATKSTPAVNNQAEFQEDDFDAINAQLRDAYEMREFDEV